MEQAVEELCEKAAERFPTSMSALIRSFNDDPIKARNVIRDALTGEDASSKNSLYHHLIGTDSVSVSNRRNRVEGTIALLRTMVHQPEFTQFISPLLQVIIGLYFYRVMLRRACNCHGKLSVSLSVCLSNL